MKKYSWVLPIKNEAGSLPQLLSEIRQVMGSMDEYEVIVVNDGSTDGTASYLDHLTLLMPQVRMIDFPKNQGKWAATAVGFAQTEGDLIIMIDSDLQDDPRELAKLLPSIEGGYDVVSGWRRTRHDPSYKIALSRFGNMLVRWLGLGTYHDLNAPFKIMRREVLPAFPTHTPWLRFLLIFAAAAGFKVIEVPIIHRPRLYGTSKFGLTKYISIVLDLLFVRFSMWFRKKGAPHQ
jgi:glycosyltransferase involved in cell wall biosynthesis